VKVFFVALIIWRLALAPLPQADNPTPGYWDRTPLPQTGLATFYSAGMMEHVQAYREAQGQLPVCPECVGAVALLRAGDIGRKVWLAPPAGERVGPFLVIDCAHWEDIPTLLGRNWVVDVSFEVPQLWGMDRPLDGVTVLADPSDAVAAGPPRPPTPFSVAPGELSISKPTPTPAVTPVPPTPWPTRQPVPLGTSWASVSAPGAPAPTVSLLPTPLTPIITTPTPRMTPRIGSEGASPTPTASAVRDDTPTPEAAIGRPGVMLLSPMPPSTAAASPNSTPTPPALSRPALRGGATPILPAQPGAPVDAPADAGLSPLQRLWRALRDLLPR